MNAKPSMQGVIENRFLLTGFIQMNFVFSGNIFIFTYCYTAKLKKIRLVPPTSYCYETMKSSTLFCLKQMR